MSSARTSPPTTPLTIHSPLLVHYLLEDFSMLSMMDQKTLAIEASGMSSSFVRAHETEDTKMTEKTPLRDAEQAELDVKIGLPNDQPTTLSTKLASLLIPAQLFEQGKAFPMPSQSTPIVTVTVDPLPSPSETENVSQTDKQQRNSRTAVISTSISTETEESPVTDFELSKPTTGVTIASFQTEATSPSIPTPADQMALSWRQKISPLCLGGSKARPSYSRTQLREKIDPFPTFIPRTPETKDMEGESTIFGTQKSLVDEAAAKAKHQPTSTWATNTPTSGLGSTLEFRPQVSRISETAHVSNRALNPPSVTRTITTPAYNPQALEWRPSDQKLGIDCVEGAQTRPCRPQLTVTVPSTPTVRVPERTDNARVLEWAKNVHPLQLSEATTPRMFSDSPIYSTQGLKSGSIFAPRRITITTPTDTKPSHERLTLAQRRAERQLAESQIAPSQSAPNTATLQLASLHTAPVAGVSATAISAHAVTSQSSPVTPSQAGWFHPVSHTQSLTWKRLTNPRLEHRPVHPELAKWTKVEQDLLRMGLIKRVPGNPDGGSFVVPKTFEQWLKFRAGRAEDALDDNTAKIRNRNFEAEAAERIRKIHNFDDIHGYVSSSHRSRRRVKIEPAMGGNDYHDGRGTVLAHPSTWSPWYQPTEERPEALWPCLEEMKEEGDERHTSAFGRFPALPRVPGNPTVVWKVKPVIPALPFDEVWKVPTRETWAELYTQKLRDPDEEYMEELIGQSLLDAISL